MRFTTFVLSVALLCCFISLLCSSVATVQARPYLFTKASTLSMTADPENIGTRTSDAGTIESIVTISYSYPRFARPQGFPLPNRKSPTSINLNIEDSPSWCDVELDATSFTADIGSFFQPGIVNVTATISVTVKDDATAFQKGTISLKANASANGNIQGSEAEFEMNVQVGFISWLESSLSNTSVTLDPGEQKNITVTVENKGNANMMVDVSTNATSTSHYMLTLPTAQSIAVDEEYDFVIKIQAPDELEEEQITVHTFTITSYAIGDQNPTGTPLDVSVSIRTLEQAADEEDVLDLTPYVIGVFVVFIMLFVIASIVAWARRR